MSAATSVSTESAGGASTWRGLLIQPIAIVVVLVAFVIWLGTAQLSETEAATLAPGPLLVLLVEHLKLTFVAAVIVLLIAVPLGILLTRGPFKKFSGPVIAVANIGQAAPAIGLVVLLAFWLGFGFWAAVVSLVLYSVLPVLRNTMIGLSQVDGGLVEAARGMGMAPMSVLLRIELPLAVPVMLAGIRTALVLLVGTATLAAFVDGGGLGLLITTGVNLYLQRVLVSGALLVALLALSIDWLARVLEQAVTPKGLR